jgi:hypothetical protein
MKTVRGRQLLAMGSYSLSDERVDLHMRDKDFGLLLIDVVYFRLIVNGLLHIEIKGFFFFLVALLQFLRALLAQFIIIWVLADLLLQS